MCQHEKISMASVEYMSIWWQLMTSTTKYKPNSSENVVMASITLVAKQWRNVWRIDNDQQTNLGVAAMWLRGLAARASRSVACENQHMAA